MQCSFIYSFTNIISINTEENIVLNNSILSTPNQPLSFSLLHSFHALWYSKKTWKKLPVKQKYSQITAVIKLVPVLEKGINMNLLTGKTDIIFYKEQIFYQWQLINTKAWHA